MATEQTLDELRRQVEVRIKQKALEVWEKLNKSERRGVEFGLFPAATMTQAECDLLREFNASDSTPVGLGRLLAVALMDCTKLNKG